MKRLLALMVMFLVVGCAPSTVEMSKADFGPPPSANTFPAIQSYMEF